MTDDDLRRVREKIEGVIRMLYAHGREGTTGGCSVCAAELKSALSLLPAPEPTLLQAAEKVLEWWKSHGWDCRGAIDALRSAVERERGSPCSG